MKRGQRPKPTALKIIEGNRGFKPLNEHEPKPAPYLPEPPEMLSGEALIEWRRVSQCLFDVGCLSRIDRSVLSAYCMAYGRWLQAEEALERCAQQDPVTHGLMVRTEKGGLKQNPLIVTARNAAGDMLRYAAEFGMTPAARTRVHAEQNPKENDPAEKFFATR